MGATSSRRTTAPPPRAASAIRFRPASVSSVPSSGTRMRLAMSLPLCVGREPDLRVRQNVPAAGLVFHDEAPIGADSNSVSEIHSRRLAHLHGSPGEPVALAPRREQRLGPLGAIRLHPPLERVQEG